MDNRAELMGAEFVRHVGRQMRALREALELDRRKLAELMGVSTYSIVMYETGERGLPPERLPVVAELLGVRPEDLVKEFRFGNDPKTVRSAKRKQKAVA